MPILKSMAGTRDPTPQFVAASLAPNEIPVIDLGPFLRGMDAVRRQAATEIGRACRETGFFYIANHEVPAALLEETFVQAARFFAKTPQEKAKIAIEQSPCHRGWFQLGGENLDPAKQVAGDLKEGIKIGRDLLPAHPKVRAMVPLHGPNQWPDEPGFHVAMQDYYEAMERLGRKLLRAFAMVLEIDGDYFDQFLGVPMCTLGPLHYPPQTGQIDEAQLGAGAHSDFGCLTILAQDDHAGLQVLRRDGTWVNAPPIPGTFVVNIGDMMERWTNGVFTSTLHRVINQTGEERYSLPFFFDPDFSARIECIPTCVKPGEAPKYPPTTAGQYLLDKINESFAYHKDKRS